MMRWKLWDNNQGKPPSHAVQTSDGMYMVLQHQVQSNDEVWSDDAKAYVRSRYMEWQDVPLHIESKT
jgi:hypothetical protein